MTKIIKESPFDEMGEITELAQEEGALTAQDAALLAGQSVEKVVPVATLFKAMGIKPEVHRAALKSDPDNKK